MMTMMKFVTAALCFTATLAVASSTDKDQCGVSVQHKTLRRRLGEPWTPEEIVGAILLAPIAIGAAATAGALCLAGVVTMGAIAGPVCAVQGAKRKAWTPTGKYQKIRQRLQSDPEEAITYLEKHPKFANKPENVLLIKQVYEKTNRKYQAPYMVRLNRMLERSGIPEIHTFYAMNSVFRHFPDWGVKVLDAILKKSGIMAAITFFNKHHQYFRHSEEFVKAGAALIFKVQSKDSVYLEKAIEYYQKNADLGSEYGFQLRRAAQRCNVKVNLRKASEWRYAPLPGTKTCSMCSGKGKTGMTMKWSKCKACGGTGKVTVNKGNKI